MAPLVEYIMMKYIALCMAAVEIYVRGMVILAYKVNRRSSQNGSCSSLYNKQNV
jgi:hypothetical protein